MKNRTELVLVLILAMLIIAGCSRKSSTSGNENQPSSTSQPVASTTPEPPPAPAPEPASPPEAAPQPETTPQPKAPPANASGEPAQKPVETAKAMPNSDVAPAPAPAPEPEPIVIPVGTQLVVRMDQKISTKTAKAGSAFNATVAKSLAVAGQTVVPKGARAEGEIVTSKSPGKFNGEGVLTVKLTKLTVGDESYPVAAKAFTVGMSGKGKRSAMMIGGGAAAGALIGGLAGGGKGAAIGALSGGGAGTAGAALTGNTELDIPVETAVGFELVQPITLKPHAAGDSTNAGTESPNQPPQAPESQPPATTPQ